MPAESEGSLSKGRLRVLCVDDDPGVLEGLCLHLRRRYTVTTATSGAAALEAIARDPGFAVIMSDMRMAGMDGATFLARARRAAPDATRILLTGSTNLDSAISAVNDGHIFRFLAKPCPTPTLLASIEAAAKQHQLITAERVLLEQTVHGSIKALTDILALTNPACFGRATRIKHLVTDLAAELDMCDVWQVEVAAMVSQLGFITLPPATVEKMSAGQPLSESERLMVEKAPGIAEQLVGNIPRLEVVREILSLSSRPYVRGAAGTVPGMPLVELAASVLRAAIEFDALEAQGFSSSLATDTLRGREDRFAPEIVEALFAIRGAGAHREEVRELPLSGLRVGMTFAEDVKTASGTLFVARGYQITEGFLERARNFPRGAVHEPIRVLLPRPARA